MEEIQSNTTIADRMPGLVAVYDVKTGQYLYTNKSVTNILGYQPEDFISGGVNFVSSLIHPDDVADIINQNKKALVEANTQSEDSPIEQLTFSFEYRMKHKDGHWVWIHTDSSVFHRNADGEVEQILNVSSNIDGRKREEEQMDLLKQDFEEVVQTQNRQLQDREWLFRSLIEVVEDYAIFRLDINGNVGSWNEGVANILGYTEDEIIGLPISIFFTDEDREKRLHEQELEHAKTKGTFSTEGIRMRKDGSTFFATTTLTPIWDERGILQGFSKIIRDVTERKEAEETIRYHAMHDTLTGLINRKSLAENFVIAHTNAIRHGNKLAIIFLDLDRLKQLTTHWVMPSVIYYSKKWRTVFATQFVKST